MNSLPFDILHHCIYPLLRSQDVAALAQTSYAMHDARNYTTAIQDATTGVVGAHSFQRMMIIMLRTGEHHELGDCDDWWITTADALRVCVPHRQLLCEIKRLLQSPRYQTLYY